MQVLKIEKKGLSVNLISGEFENLTSEFQASLIREKSEPCPHKEFEKILASLKEDFVYDVAYILEKEGIEVSTVSLNGGFLEWISYVNKSLERIENAHKYSPKYIESITRLATSSEYFVSLLERQISLRIQRSIQELERQENFTEEFLERINSIFQSANRESGYKGKSFHICKNHTIGFNLNFIGWISIKL